MALRIPRGGYQQLFNEGYKFLQGIDEAVLRNINATHELAKITRTSFGPNGRNKMVVNQLEKLFVTNDAATIVRELDVVHPAAKLLVMSAQQQESEFGDGTNFVLVFAGELLQNAEHLLRMGLHPSDVVAGYELAIEKTNEIFKELPVQKIENLKEKSSLLTSAVRTAIASKQSGHEELLADLVIDAALAIMPSNPQHFNVDNVRVVKVMGASIYESQMVRGMVFGREPEGVVKRAEKAKIAVFTCPIDISQTETKGTVLLRNASEMLEYTRGEEMQIETAVKELVNANVKVAVTGASVGELALHYLNRYGIMVVKVLSKFDLRRLCRVTGATALARLGAPMAEEMGFCDVVETVEIGSDNVTVFRQEQELTRTVTIVIRGATQNQMDDVERAIDDGVNVVKALTKDARLVPGAGASEMEILKRLSAIAERTPGLNQHVLKKYAEAFEVVPRSLAENAGHDGTEMLAKLYAAHHQDAETGRTTGVNVEEGGTIDAEKSGILDVFAAKQWAIHLATTAALTVLRVDNIIISKPAGGPKPPKKSGNWDADD
ncbi:uncharacterized protein VTP21DRAFT_7821 [Calcarisporiella thermophila]|uniref:uncharacterized protein n=1 Tax=Calcarisporiella thermophila TaxID=911321 RepID=UPI00374313CB